MDHDIQFTRTFEHALWVDGVDRVTAGGEHGFNARFQLLEADLDSLATRVKEVNAALNDGRDELYAGIAATSRDGAGRVGSLTASFVVFTDLAVPDPPNNDFSFSGGTAIVGGRPVRLPAGTAFRYSEQSWTDAARAAADGVPVIPPLTTPSVDRTDLVYLDAWERPAAVAGVRRVVREVAVRVVEGGVTLPTPVAGHLHMPLARLHRTAGQELILPGEIEDRRPVIDVGPKQRELSLPPLFHPETFPGWVAWQTIKVDARLFASKEANLRCTGMLPVVLPTGARLVQVLVRGDMRTQPGGTVDLVLELVRSATGVAEFDGNVLAQSTLVTAGTFSRALIVAPDNGRHVVDNLNFSYYLYAWAQSGEVEIHGVRVSYEF